MKPVLSREQVRAFDVHAIAHGVPGLVLMENAGRGAAEVILERLARVRGPVVVVCGAGNNGGDGFVVARRLLTCGHDVRVLLVVDPTKLTGDARANHDAWVGVGGVVAQGHDGDREAFERELVGATVIVDALLGTGLDRAVTGWLAAVIEQINRAPSYRIALDVPSGLHADTGVALGAAIVAHETVTFAQMKLGLVTSAGAERAGRTTVVDIGVPKEAALAVGASAYILEAADVARWLEPRAFAAHKGSAGRVVAIAGSPGKIGAALLVAHGSLRAGAGLVTLCAPPAAADVFDGRVLEVMTARIDPRRVEASLGEHLRGADAVVIGPGIGLDAGARAVVDHVALRHDGPVVIDADALTHLAGRLSELRSAKGSRILTPHPGEMARLLGITTAEVEHDRFGAVARAVSESHAVVLLKGARTLIGAPEEPTVVNPSGSPALATAGSGDVLSGITAALLATLRDARRAACASAFLHGVAGEAWARAHDGADRGLLAHEIADGVPRAIAGLTRTPSTLPV